MVQELIDLKFIEFSKKEARTPPEIVNINIKNRSKPYRAFSIKIIPNRANYQQF